MVEQARGTASTGHGGAFWWTKRVANPVLGWLVRGPLGSRSGRRLAVLRYRGRRTGRPHELVVQYARDGNRIWVMPGRPERKRWWRNLVQPAPVELWLAGRHVHGVAVALTGRDEVAAALSAYRAAFPRTADTGGSTAMVRIDLPAPEQEGDAGS